MDEKLKSIVEKAVTGDTMAFERLIIMKQKDILYIAQYYSNMQTAEDCVQESVCRMFREIKKLRNPESFEPWMYRIIQTTCATVLKKHITQKNKQVSIDTAPEVDALEELETSFLPSSYVEDQDRRREVMEIIHELPDNYRDCLLLYYYQRLNYSEIADVLEVNEGKVANDLTRARRLVKKHLEKRWGKEIVFTVAPFTAVPTLSKLFDLEATALATSETGIRMAEGMQKAYAAGLNGTTRVSKVSMVKSAGVVVSGIVVTTAIVFAVWGMSGTREESNPEVVQRTVETKAEEQSKPEAQTELKQIESIEDMIGGAAANELYEYEKQQVLSEEWKVFLDRIGAEQLLDMEDSEGYLYQVYRLEKQEKRLLLMSKTQLDGGRTEVQYRFGGFDLQIPSDLEVTFLF